MSAPTYLQAVERCVTALFPQAADFPGAEFVRLLALAGEACTGTPVGSSPPFDSGIAPGRIPLELSVTAGAHGPLALRFLVQPAPNLPRAMPALRQRMAALAQACGCAELLPLQEALLDSLVAGQECLRGNFSAWLGLQQRPARSPALKVYLNPWTYAAGSPVEWLFLAASWTPWLAEGLPTLAEMFRLLPAAAPMILGLDADARGLDCVKIYFMTHTTEPATVEPLLARWGTEAQRRAWALVQAETCWRQPYDAASVELDLAMRIRGGEPASLKVNIFCPHAFADDADALRAVSLWARQGYGLPTDLAWLASALDETRLLPGRRLNFVGLGENKLDVYFRPW